MSDFLALLRAGITGDTDHVFDHDIDWAKVRQLAVRQGVLPIVFDGYQCYYEKCSLKAPVEVKLEWYAAAQQAERHYAI